MFQLRVRGSGDGSSGSGGVGGGVERLKEGSSPMTGMEIEVFADRGYDTEVNFRVLAVGKKGKDVSRIGVLSAVVVHLCGEWDRLLSEGPFAGWLEVEG